MSEIESEFGIALKVLGDWRVIFIAIAILLVWIALRYVGSIYHRRPKIAVKPFAPPPAKAAASTPASRQAAARTRRGEDVVE